MAMPKLVNWDNSDIAVFSSDTSPIPEGPRSRATLVAYKADQYVQALHAAKHARIFQDMPVAIIAHFIS